MTSLDHTTLCCLQGLRSLPLLFPGQEQLQAVASQGAWRPQTPDWRFTSSWLRICCGLCTCNFTTTTYSGCHPRDVLSLIYTGASHCLHHSKIRLCQRSISNTFNIGILYIKSKQQENKFWEICIYVMY